MEKSPNGGLYPVGGLAESVINLFAPSKSFINCPAGSQLFRPGAKGKNMEEKYAFEISRVLYEMFLVISDDTGLAPDEILRCFLLCSVLDYFKERNHSKT
ncbi:MAG: hypothetical protein K6F35_08000 [Lachnospiraceae bacterium]|nr:hypothetical protein [Lachnospiraceae bacterium]